MVPTSSALVIPEWSEDPQKPRFGFEPRSGLPAGVGHGARFTATIRRFGRSMAFQTSLVAPTPMRSTKWYGPKG